MIDDTISMIVAFGVTVIGAYVAFDLWLNIGHELVAIIPLALAMIMFSDVVESIIYKTKRKVRR